MVDYFMIIIINIFKYYRSESEINKNYNFSKIVSTEKLLRLN